MVYAHAHDKTVEADYFAAISRIETRLALVAEPEPKSESVQEEREQILALTVQLAAPDLSFALSLEIVLQIRGLLQMQTATQDELRTPAAGILEWIPPPAVRAFVGAEAV